MSLPVVSVLIPTYNHRAHIAQAVESALAQETDFPLEILVGDDASFDGTPELLRTLADAHPGRIVLHLSMENKGGHVNFSRLYQAARGEFIALLEGDDFWTDRKKLQKQVEFLRGAPDFALVFHPLAIRYEDEPDKEDGVTNRGDPAVSGLDRLARFNYLHTASVLFRNGLIPDLPEWVHRLALGDWPLFALLAEHGKLRMLDEVMGVYRVHKGGVWGHRSERYRLVRTVGAAVACRQHIGHPGFDDCIYKMSKRLVPLLLRERRWRAAMRFTGKAVAALLRSPHLLAGKKRKRSGSRGRPPSRV